MLKELEGMWNNIFLKTRWKLKTCTKPKGDNASDGKTSVPSSLVPNEPSTSASTLQEHATLNLKPLFIIVSQDCVETNFNMQMTKTYLTKEHLPLDREQP